MNTIGIIGAMPSELHDIRETLKDAEVIHIGSFDFYKNTLNGKNIINVCCGVGKVNSAICTQMLIDNFKVDYIINTGVSGGMNSQVKVCDIVISSEVLAHDVNLTFLEKYPPYCSIFKSSDVLINYTVESCKSLDYKYFIGRIASGEQFISDNAIKQDIQTRLNPYAVDMESASIGHCAYVNKIPSISIRCISDNADDDGNISFEEFEKISAKRVANVVLDVISKL
ncbi:MAG: 5'-methylthioadenosine/adenosylhomocysteine nucleosidase [Ruminococcus sp.]|nr:5'-methylthioadenosine/adenosylhomocysteine nucleosidase [Ruminococcus sp.]MCD7801030.1 5'-methylthioadenosine/adenosylhomocysteine nucleosidase [Ruminococcus sp.]